MTAQPTATEPTEPTPTPTPRAAAAPAVQLWSTAQVARHLSVNVVTVRRWIEAGTLPAVRVGRAWRVDPRQLAVVMRRSQPLANRQAQL